MPARQSARAALLPSHTGRPGKADCGTDGGNQENTKYEGRGSKDEVKSSLSLPTLYFVLLTFSAHGALSECTYPSLQRLLLAGPFPPRLRESRLPASR